jgi:hypothetical protein
LGTVTLMAAVFAVGGALGAWVGVMIYSHRIKGPRKSDPDASESSRLSRLGERVSSTKLHIQLNLWGVGVWLVLLVPTVLIWRESVAWVVFMSWYANFVGHISAYIAAKAEETVENGNGSA